MLNLVVENWPNSDSNTPFSSGGPWGPKHYQNHWLAL